MNIPELKVDPKYPHHYVIGVDIAGIRSATPGKMMIRFGPIHFTNEDITKMRRAVILKNDKLFTMTQKQALDVAGCSEIVQTLSVILHVKGFLDTTIHHFSSEEEIDNEWFSTLVETANKDQYTKEILISAKIG